MNHTNEDDDLYGGYDEPSNPLAGSNGAGMFQALAGGNPNGQPPGTAGGNYPPGTAMRFNAPGTAAGRVGTAMQNEQGMARPMTSNKGAGFSSAPTKRFDPMSRTAASAAASGALQRKSDADVEEQSKELEQKVHQLLEQSASLCADGNTDTGLERAVEAKKRERLLCKFRETNNQKDSINVDLTYAVDFNLAHSYHANKNYQEALAAFTTIVKNKELEQSCRLRVNMGNIHFEQKKYSNAIKMYRMALDQISPTAKEIRYKVMRNIGLAFVRMGQYLDALQEFSTVMDNVPDHQTGYNLVVCSYALGDREGMKRSFLRLLNVPRYETEEEQEELELLAEEEEDQELVVRHADGLRDEIRKRQNYISRVIVQSAALISEKIERSGFDAGYDWCVEQLVQAKWSALANEVELAKASKFMANKEFDKAVAVFKEFEKKEPRVKARAATNLSFLYFLEGEMENANKYSELALKSDRYNARAFVNKGNVLLERGEHDEARLLFQKAIDVEPNCVEARFNLGLANIRLGELDAALQAFKKLHHMLPDNVEAIYQIANVYDLMGDFKDAVKWFEMLSSLVPNDPGVLSRLGAIHARFDDEVKALHYYQESYRVYPVHIDVISWLGAFHVKSEVWEKAIPYFDLASKIQPTESKWCLMVASCFRRIQALPQALSKYKEVHKEHPENLECLRYLVHLCTEMGRRPEAQEYMTKHTKAQKSADATLAASTMQQQQQRPSSQQDQQNQQQQGRGGMEYGGGGGGGGGRDNSNGSPQQGMGMDLMGGLDESNIGGLGANIPKVGGRKMVVREKAEVKESDEWGNGGLGDDLLPM
ncbi:MAG: hypothetical protein WDW36_008545 [Sanguina aurantia]